MSKKTIDTVVEDVYEIIENGVDIDDKDFNMFAYELAKVIKSRLSKKEKKEETDEKKTRRGRLRPSNLGYPDRRLYFEINKAPEKKYTPQLLLNFLFGDLWETILLFLAHQAGHTVEDRQRRVTGGGISGSIDAKIDGVITDVKTALDFDKFSRGTIFHPGNDQYGYIGQMSYYVQFHFDEDYLENKNRGVFWATDKTGRMTTLSVHPMEQVNAKKRIEDVLQFIYKDEPPEELCYEPVEEKSGNLALAKGCQNCPFKQECYPDLRAFQYSNRTKYYSKIIEGREPSVPEVEIE